MSSTDLHRALTQAVGPAHVLTEPDIVAGYVRDWTGRWTGRTSAVVRPGSADEVQAVVRICHESGTSLVPQGGNTGLVGGSIPHQGEVVLSLRRLDRMGPVDQRSMAVTAGAGVTIGALQAHAREEGLDYGVDLASRDSATIGGTIATNAGGARVVSNGDTRRQVRGLEVVFADGRLGSNLEGGKQSTGPDPFQLMVGSEGTLGVITSARLRLLPRVDAEPMVVLAAVETLGEGLRFGVPGVRAIEFFDRACLEAVVEHSDLPRPLSADAPFYVLIESTQPPQVPEDMPAVADRRLWAYRESITETLSRIGVPAKADVAVPPERVDDLVAAIEGLDLGGNVYLFGHLAEGNFHVNILGSSDPDRAVDEVLKAVFELGGSIASEHGIGVAKAGWWRRTMEPPAIEFNRRVKEALDPGRILNPQVFWGG